MRVVQVNCVYKKGSTGKIVYDLHTAYQAQGMESFVCYGRGEKTAEENVYKTASETVSKAYNVLSRLTGIQYGGNWSGTVKLIWKIKEIKPDVVHLHCINGFFVNIYRLLGWLKKNRIPTAVTLHAEFMHTGSCAYALDCEQWKDNDGCKKCPQLREATGSLLLDRTHTAWRRMRKAFDGFENLTVVSVSPWLEERAKQSTILKKSNHTCVFNGVDTDTVFHYRQTGELREKLGLQGKSVVLYVTAAFDTFKGAHYVLELARRMPEITFLVIGNRGDIGEHPENVLALGRVENQEELARYYAMADVTLLTSKKETFSMVCAESLCCGTPVVGFEAGAPETISLPKYSAFCRYGDVDSLESLLKKAIQNEAYQNKKDISRQAGSVYGKQNMCERYVRIYKGLTDEN